jgi:hypothetical protein
MARIDEAHTGGGNVAPESDDMVLNYREASKFLGISGRTLERYVRESRIPQRQVSATRRPSDRREVPAVATATMAQTADGARGPRGTTTPL